MRHEVVEHIPAFHVGEVYAKKHIGDFRKLWKVHAAEDVKAACAPRPLYNKGIFVDKKAAETKLPEAQALYGDCFFNGTGTLQNYREAVKYYKIGARGKDPHAYYCLGRCSELGVGGLPKNMKEAIKNYQEAADYGDDDAAYELGDYYTNPNNKDHDLEEGFSNFEAAANRNYTPAIVRLAMCYFEGIGIEPDKDYAHDLGIKAMQLGNLDAKEFLKNYFNEEY